MQWQQEDQSHQNNKTKILSATFTLCQKLHVLQTYKGVHSNKHFKEKLAIRVSAQLGQITPRETESLLFHNLGKKHSVSCTGCKLQPEGCLLSAGSSSARKTQHPPDSSGAIHSWIKYSGVTYGVNRSLTPPSPKTFYSMRQRIFWRDL